MSARYLKCTIVTNECDILTVLRFWETPEIIEQYVF